MGVPVRPRLAVRKIPHDFPCGIFQFFHKTNGGAINTYLFIPIFRLLHVFQTLYHRCDVRAVFLENLTYGG